MEKIFISIASYCDPLLISTVQSALKNAKYPERLRFGIVEQQLPELRMSLADDAAKALVRYVGINPEESRGVCWARALVNTLYEGEEYFLQIDSHMLFEQTWDEKLIDDLHFCQHDNVKSLLTSYPNHFEFINGIPTPMPVTKKVLAHVVKPDQVLIDDNPIMLFQAIPLDLDHAVKGFHIAGGCLFGPGRFLSEVPYDPALYFHGEEQTIAARAYTHGWDIWHPCQLPLYHYYDLKPEDNIREKHWSEKSNSKRYRKHWEFEQAALKRVISLLYNHEDLGIYGFGHSRSFDEYCNFSGLMYETRHITDRARYGPWIDKVKMKQLQLEKKMTRVRINEKEYDLDTLPADVRAELEMLIATESKILELQRDLAIMQTARNAYSSSLQSKIS
jgi:hypothetical protein